MKWMNVAINQYGIITGMRIKHYHFSWLFLLKNDKKPMFRLKFIKYFRVK